MSINSISSETVEEEKLQRDNSITEKQLNRIVPIPPFKCLSKSPSASNSITVNFDLNTSCFFSLPDLTDMTVNLLVFTRPQGMSIGEVMATKDGFSISSSDSSKQNNNQHEYDDDISTITSTTDNKMNSICKLIGNIAPIYDGNVEFFFFIQISFNNNVPITIRYTLR